MRENGGACHMDGQNISKMAHDDGDSRSRAPFLEYLLPRSLFFWGNGIIPIMKLVKNLRRWR